MNQGNMKNFIYYISDYDYITPLPLKLFGELIKTTGTQKKINLILKQENNFQIYLRYFYLLILWILIIYNMKYQSFKVCYSFLLQCLHF